MKAGLGDLLGVSDLDCTKGNFDGDELQRFSCDATLWWPVSENAVGIPREAERAFRLVLSSFRLALEPFSD